MRREKLCRILGYVLPFAVVGGGLYVASVGFIGIVKALDKAGVPDEITAAVTGSIVLIILGTGLAAGFAGDMFEAIKWLVRGRRSGKDNPIPCEERGSAGA